MRTRAQAILDVIAEPESRVSLDWYVTDWNTFTSLDLSDRVNVDLGTVASDGFIEAIRCRIPRSGQNIVCTLDVSLVD